MQNLFKNFIYLLALQTAARAFNPNRRQTFINDAVWSAHISPDIVNELKDFANLIPATTIDEIVAKHLLIDGNFRTALKYLRSSQFTQVQRQLLDLPEVLVVLEFLHLTTANATLAHMDAIATAVELIVIDVHQPAIGCTEDDNDAITTNTGTVIINTANSAHNFNTIELAKEKFNKEKMLHKGPLPSPPPPPPSTYRQLLYAGIDAKDDETTASSYNIEQPLVSIVLLEDSVVKTNSLDVANYNEGHHHQWHSRIYHHRRRHHPQHYRPLGTFTAFVAEVLQHLPHTAYQNMIKEKCQRNAKFAEFYHALRSPDLKPLIEQTLKTENLMNVIRTLNSHDVDVLDLKPIAFQVISWGPNI